jgi:class 3 adenylate cyclase/tetratricopeptide (TPR) repeat protein
MCSAGASVSIMDLGAWLRSLGLERYETVFRENAIDADLLHDLTEDHLREIGLPLGARLKLRKAISALIPRPEPISPVLPVAPSVPPADTAERRQVTVMFSDLVGSTALAARMDPEDLREIISAYQKCVAKTVQRYDGFVARYMGDGVLVHFGYPRAHEDDAERAVRAGLELVVAVAALKSPTPLQTRIGIATGIVVVGELIGSGDAQERAIVGKTLNLAARLQGIAKADMVVICDSTRKLLGNLFELEDLGPTELKGITEPTRAWAALRASSAESRFEAMHASGLTALVGREEQSELLLRRWSKAKTGEGQVVLLSGEAGIGKSRLAAALLEGLAGDPYTRLRYFCSPQHTDSALYPVVSQLERAAGLTREDTQQAKLDNLDALLAQSSASAQDAALIAEMLSLQNDGRYPALDLTPQQRRQKTLEVLTAQLEALTRQRPVLQILEDAHWADPTTLEVFGRAVDRIRTLPVLLIVTFRPEFEPPWIGQPHVTVLIINRLTAREVGAIIDRIVGNKRLPASIRPDIIERTDGIPLFVEEMTKAVLEAQSEHAVERAAAAVPSPALAVPASLHASLMARLDRLGAAKEVAQIGAAIGREFPHALLAAVVHQSEEQLGSALNRLMAAGLLFRKGMPPHASYLFKHALVQDTAYGTLLREPRRSLHARIADTLESQFAEIADHQPELLARHCTEAGLTARAIVYWVRAGQRAVERSANAEAIRHLGHALDLLSPQPETPERARQELMVQMLLAQALMATRGMAAPEVERAYARARELCDVLGHSDQLLAPGGLGTFYLVRGDIRAALETGEQCLDVAQRLRDAGLLLKAHAGQGTVLVFLGELESSRAHLARGLRLAEAMTPCPLDFGGRDAGVGCLIFDGWAGCLLGSPDEALASVTAALARAETRSHPFSLAFALSWAARLHHFRREEQRCREQAEAAIDLAIKYDFTQWRVIAMMLRGSSLAGEGRGDEGIDQLREGLAAWRAMGAELLRPYFLALLAEAYWRMGRADEGLAAVAEALSLVECTGERMYEAELHRVHGELLRARESGEAATDAAGACFQRALAAARRQGARALELRAAMSLSRLLEHADGQARQEAHRALAEVYATFKSGFDTADLREARALLSSSPP